MFSRLMQAVDSLRPRTLTRTTKSVSNLLAEAQRVRKAIKEAEVASKRLDALTERLQVRTHELERSLADISFREASLAAIYRRDRELAMECELLPGVLDAVAVARHSIDAIERSTLHVSPFPHIVVDDVWPETFYQALVAGIPPAELFADRPVNKRRLVVPFKWAPIYSTRVWNFVHRDVFDRLTPAIVNKFRTQLEEWFLSQWPLPEESAIEGVRFEATNGRILLRQRGYNIPPHRDPKWGIVTCLLYLARPGDSERWGTQLYRVDQDVEAPHVSANWIDAGACHLDKDVTFRRNRMLVFMNSHGAHGAHIPKDAEPAGLERYAYQCRIGPDQRSMEMLLDLLPEERRAVWTGLDKGYG